MGAIIGLANELRFWPGGTTPSVGNFTLNQATDAWETIFQAVEDATITALGYRQGTLTGSAPVFKISLQGVDGSGNPDGTILGGGSPASKTFTPTSGNNNTWTWQTLDNSIAVTRGQLLSIVIARDSGTIDGSNNCSFASTAALGVTVGMPYNIQNDNGVRTRQVTSPIFGYKSSTRVYGQPCQTAQAVGYNSGSTPDERANLLNIPTTWWSTYKIIGVAWYGVLAAATTVDIVLYDSDGSTVLQSITLDSDYTQSVSNRRFEMLFDESTLSTLNAGTNYYLAVKPAATSHTLAGVTVSATADLDAYVAGASVCQAASRTDAGAWTTDNTTRWAINPIVADITAPSGGSGVVAVIGE